MPNPQSTLGRLKAGNLPTLNQDPYPSLGAWWNQVWDGDILVARAYGDTPEEARQRAHYIANSVNYLNLATGFLPPGPTLIKAMEPAKDPGSEAALKAAVSAIYFADNSDYLSALWDVVKALNPDLVEVLYLNPREAYKHVSKEEG